MITKDIVFVIGAGGSIPYGFPSGADLVDEIVSSTIQGNNKLLENHLGANSEDQKNFSRLLKDSKTPSIDLFLSSQEELFRRIGKYYIAYLIGSRYSCTPNVVEKQKTDDWYRIIYHNMMTSFDKIAENKISFISFNYDTSLENYIYHSFRSLFNSKPVEELNEMMKTFNFIHIYGTIDQMPWNKEDYRIAPLIHRNNPVEIEKLVQGIKVIDEGHSNDSDIEKAKQLMLDAKNIYITGFGFNETNIKLIGLDNKEFHKGKRVVSNSFKMGRAQREDISDLLGYHPFIVPSTLFNSQFISESVRFR